MAIISFIGGSEIIFIFLVILLLFGSKRIPEFAKMMGKGLREFRKATEDIKREINNETDDVSDDLKKMKNTFKS
ncbi:MAG: twin-arginine translocase TatA/TatE family subunit [Bacteroidales bacterium]|nr:twin-arginine translocase TatA/TatE family subunit [Bacteroidales bacterium]MBN2817488.1 twin-arginine translocase TatA/TatE family subunit [Bacteroidales bacterium]